MSATILGPLDQNGNVRVADQTATELIHALRFQPNDEHDYDLSRFKQIRFGRGTSGGCTSNDHLSFTAMEGTHYSVGSWYYCISPDALSATFDTLGRMVRIRCSCSAFIDIVILGRTN